LELELPKILADLKSQGVNTLLVEGGAYILQTFIAQGFFDRIRAAFAPEILGSLGGAQIASNKCIELSLRLTKIRKVGAMSVVEYART
jgi:riboflavin biosynthesis pyrimidine reductase